MRPNQLDRAILAVEHEAQAIARAIAVLKTQRVAVGVKRIPTLVVDRRPS